MFENIELDGFPLCQAMDDPIVIEWLDRLPWLKDAFISGKIRGVVLMPEAKIINVHSSMSESDIAILKSELGVLVGVID